MAYADMTPKRRAFATYKSIPGTTGSEAAIKAGFSKNPASAATIASNLLKDIDVQQEIARRTEDRMMAAGVSFIDNAKTLKALRDKCLQEGPKGESFHPAGVLGATDQLNKMGGYYEADKEKEKDLNVRLPELIKKYERDA